MNRFTIHVAYPGDRGELRLRSELDWDHDLTPERSDRDGADFVIRGDRPYLYVKPMLLRDGRAEWADGENLLVLPDERRVLFPRFMPEARCSVCELQEFAADDGAPLKIRVHLPPGYDENPLRRYPVLYMQDGNNLFFEAEAFGGHTWGVQETLADLEAMSLVDAPIVVGIQPRDRLEQYTLPGYEAYGRLLTEHLVPRIDANYRTLTGPRHTAVIGSSLGGVVSFHLAWRHPEVFGQAACLSSTFGYRDDLMERVAREPRRPIRLYLDSGWPRDNYEVTRAMTALLCGRGYRVGVDLLHLAIPHAAHQEQAWRTRLHLPLQFLFGASAAAGAIGN